MSRAAVMTSTSNAETQYSPLSTLEKQWAGPVGHRILLFVKTNPNCCLIGGVEALLKQSKNSQMMSSTGGESSSALFGLPSSEETSSTASGSALTANCGDDPFAFLNDEGSSSSSSAAAASSLNGSQQQPKLKPHQQVGKFFKKVAKQTQHSLEKGMTNLAIKADQGKNPDILQVGLYDSSSQLLSMTEAQPLPLTDVDRMKGVTFGVPLTVPPGLEQNAALTLKLWIKSGALLLKQALAKYYLLGQCHLSHAQLTQQYLLQTNKATINVPLQSQVVVDGQFHMLISKDLKFPVQYGPGWSLTDPSMEGYTNSAAPLFQWPLDQSYGWYQHDKDPSKWLVASERATESSVILPIATAFCQLASTACHISLTHATSVMQLLLANRHDSPEGHKAQCVLKVGYLLKMGDPNRQPAANLSLHWQRPDSIFEVEMMSATKIPVVQQNVPFQAAVEKTFWAKIITDKQQALPAVQAQQLPYPVLLGNVRLQLQLSTPKTSTSADPFSSIGSGTQAVTAEEEIWQATFALEPYLKQSRDQAMQIPVYHTVTGKHMGSVVLQIQVTMPTKAAQQPTPTTSVGGLLSLVGLDTLMETSGTLPILDYETPVSSSDPRRYQQLKTMGNFITHQYLQQHVSQTRSQDMTKLMDRLEKYQLALSYNPQSEILPPHQDKTPKPFRPSSSRSTELLAGIGFNVHVASLAFTEEQGYFHNVTCGAPADHARGFGAVFQGGPSGGLRRLEQRRVELVQQLQDAQNALIQAVGQFFVTSRQHSPGINHIPARNQQVSHLRWKVYEMTQNLHTLTWQCAMRRHNCFSQALGIAVSSYLTCISDHSKVQWHDLWVKHGFLITYEGLLSAAGKELGMIEDASVGISMLRMVTIQLVSANMAMAGNKVDVVYSQHLKWLSLEANGAGSATEYRLTIGIDPQYYNTHLSAPLKNGAVVRFYPLLYQVGVDIHQAAVHTQRKVKNQMQQQLVNTAGSINSGYGSQQSQQTSMPPGLNLNDEDEDDEGAADPDVLVALNYEALRKMNAYAHSISPIAAATGQVQPPPQQQLQVHPVLTQLYNHIIQSSGKMNHGILDEAAVVAQKLGGGGVVFCKSGKDRTGMQITYKEAQYIRHYLKDYTPTRVYEDANKLRVYGTRLPICQKNVGQAKYAFNTLQVRFMPDTLKPPINTLAGFLKGGAVFKGGAIES